MDCVVKDLVLDRKDACVSFQEIILVILKMASNMAADIQYGPKTSSKWRIAIVFVAANTH